MTSSGHHYPPVTSLNHVAMATGPDEFQSPAVSNSQGACEDVAALKSDATGENLFTDGHQEVNASVEFHEEKPQRVDDEILFERIKSPLVEPSEEGDMDMECTEMTEEFESDNKTPVEACLHPYLLRFCCPECSVSFSTETELTSHINQLHTGEKPSRCGKCQRMFTSVSESLLHEASRHRRHLYTCGRCHVLFDVAARPSQTHPARTNQVIPGQADSHKTTKDSLPSNDSVADVESGSNESGENSLPSTILQFSCKECYLGFPSEAELTAHANQVHSDRKPCKCSVCDKFFTSLNDLEIHQLSHQSRVFHTCYDCDMTFNDSAAFNRHRQMHERTRTGEKPLPKECEECGRCFRCPAQLLRHLSNAHGGERTKYECDDCEASFGEKSSLRKHRRQAHQQAEERFSCDQCGKEFSHASQLKRHMTRHTDQRPHECDHCDQTFKDSSYLKKHMRRFHDDDKDDRTFQCPQCSKVYPTAANLKRHLRIHTGEKPYKCDVCHRMFSDQSNLSAHKKRGRCAQRQDGPPSPVEKPFVCNTCGKSFSQQNNLARHERTHTGEKPYKCEHCDKPFADRSYLIKHCRQEHGVELSSRIGRGGRSSRQSSENLDTNSEADNSLSAGTEKPHVCEECGKSFQLASQLRRHIQTHGQKTIQCNECGKFLTSLGNLKAHKRVHTGEKPYQCESCGNRFARLSTLVYHRRTHTGEKPHQCDVCGRGFSVSSALIKHKRSIHIGEKPYQCNHCGKFFSRTSNLKKHLRTHTGERPHQCEQCGRRFRERNHLTTHIKLIHSGEKPQKSLLGKHDDPRHGVASPNSAAESLLALSRDDPITASLFVQRRDDLTAAMTSQRRDDLTAAMTSQRRDESILTSMLSHRFDDNLSSSHAPVRVDRMSHLHRREDVMTSSMHVERRNDPAAAAAFFQQRRDDPVPAPGPLLGQRRPDPAAMYPDLPLILMKDVGYS